MSLWMWAEAYEHEERVQASKSVAHHVVAFLSQSRTTWILELAIGGFARGTIVARFQEVTIVFKFRIL